MAKKQYRSIDEITHNGKTLRDIVDAHLVWIGSRGKRGNRADLSMADLSTADLHRVNLRGADLVGANLIMADLSEAELSAADLMRTLLNGTNLSQAKLDGANLFRAKLITADLSMADLSGAELRWTDLSWANLSAAVLNGANLLRAGLHGANFNMAVFRFTVVSACDLSNVLALETVQHDGPSSIGIDTLFYSHGKIPEAFLQGAGVPNIFIRYVKSLIENPIQVYSCFISNASKDVGFVQDLLGQLRDRGVRCWYYREDAKWGGRFRKILAAPSTTTTS